MLQVPSHVMLGIQKHEEAPPTAQHLLLPLGEAHPHRHPSDFSNGTLQRRSDELMKYMSFLVIYDLSTYSKFSHFRLTSDAMSFPFGVSYHSRNGRSK